jgi:hypothetical protein
LANSSITITAITMAAAMIRMSSAIPTAVITESSEKMMPEGGSRALFER